MRTSRLNRNLTTSVWIVYILIVFEILYMISPFAFYYYSAYSVPLKFLQKTPLTSWLTVHLLPHFTYQNSLVISLLNLMSWPLIVFGLILFLVAFVQIYWAKFLRKGTVTGGLYKVIRHPQYLALAIVGLGTTIYWSRFIVFIMYAVMLFLYYYLARQEEKICVEKFGEAYEAYLTKTGMFFPKFIEDRLPEFPSLLPAKGAIRLFTIMGIFIAYLTVVIFLGVGIKNFALSQITYQFSENRAIVSVAPLTHEEIKKAVSIAFSEPDVKQKTGAIDKLLAYILPTEWSIPELGVEGAGKPANHLLHPETHGNSLDFDHSQLTLLIVEPLPVLSDIQGRNILKKSLSYKPVMEVTVNLDTYQYIGIKDRSDRGRWDGIPVPIY